MQMLYSNEKPQVVERLLSINNYSRSILIQFLANLFEDSSLAKGLIWGSCNYPQRLEKKARLKIGLDNSYVK